MYTGHQANEDVSGLFDEMPEHVQDFVISESALRRLPAIAQTCLGRQRTGKRPFASQNRAVCGEGI